MIINWVELFHDPFWRLVPEYIQGKTVSDNISQMRLLMIKSGATKSRFSQEKGVNLDKTKYKGEIE